MLNDNFERFLNRLRAVAKDEFRGRYGDNPRPGQSASAAIIKFTLYSRNGELVGWSKPQRTPLEPCPFDITIFDLEIVQAGWNGVFIDLKRECSRGVNPIEKALVIRENGEPAGWFADKVKIGV